MTPARPAWTDIQRLVAEHLALHDGVDESFRLRDVKSEQALVADYSGRVVYELVQNALDRAREHIVVVLASDPSAGTQALLVANDHLPVSAYDRPRVPPTTGPPHCDLHALLSTHTSSKSARDSVGNKGVGFRSVFGSARRVEVWSRCDRGWWGLDMRHPSRHPDKPAGWSSADVASFYRPQLLPPLSTADLAERLSVALPVPLSELTTVIRLPALRPHALEEVERSIDELSRPSTPLLFLSGRGKHAMGLTLRFARGGAVVARRLDDETGWVADIHGHIAQDAATRTETRLQLERGEVRLALPPESAADHVPLPLLWSYLPTMEPSSFGVHVHADFYLTGSRRNVQLTFRNAWERARSDGPSPQAWNQRLLEEAARLIVDELWTRPEVLRRTDFWQLATPDAGHCKALLQAVIHRLNDRDRFVALVEGAFAEPPPEGWPLRRYVDFFNALHAWGGNLYNHNLGKQGASRERYRRWIRGSSARVLPIVADANDPEARVAHAVSLPGSDRTVFLSRQGGLTLPPGVADGIQVTAFAPPTMREPKEFGLVEFNRPELLARLRPGDDEAGHLAVLQVALRLGFERAREEGGRGSVFERTRTEAPYAGSGPLWRLRAEAGATDALARAGRRLARLHVPTSDGAWHPASRTTSGVQANLPWPTLDVGRLATMLPEGVAVDDAAALLGVTRGPQVAVGPDGEARVVHLDRPAVGAALLGAWSHDVGCLLRGGNTLAVQSLRRFLRDSRWVAPGLSASEVGGALLLPGAEPTCIAPRELWLVHAGGSGFQSPLLPRLAVESFAAAPVWAVDLGVTQLDADADPDALIGLMRRLHAQGDPDIHTTRDLEQLYVRVVRSLPKGVDLGPLPILVRRRSPGGAGDGTGWQRQASDDEPQEQVWFDGGPPHARALTAFDQATVWVVRGTRRPLAERLGLLTFKPVGIPRWEGDADPERAAALRRSLTDALPDIFAGALSEAPRINQNFDPDQALAEWMRVRERIRHYPSVWIDYTFQGRTGPLGHAEKGDAFWVEKSSHGPLLLVDGAYTPVVAAARELSGVLANRAFRDVFAEAAHAWTREEEAADGASDSVRRFRRTWGVSDDDVGYWRDRIIGSELEPGEDALWKRQVLVALAQFGTPRADSVEVGRAIQPATWSAVTEPDASASDVERALRAALGSNARLARLAPPVRLASAHVQAVEAIQRRRASDGEWPGKPAVHHLVALKLVADDPADWKEEQRRALAAKARAPLVTAEQAALDRLEVDAWDVLCSRLEVDPAGASAPGWDAAVAFARGQIKVRGLPKPTDEPGKLIPRQAGASEAVLTPSSTEEYLRRNRKKAERGEAAEVGLLELVVDDALKWVLEDPIGFRAAVEQTQAHSPDARKRLLPLLDAAVDDPDPRRLAALLQVSTWFGNAGYDLLVPARPGFRLVEVKRVARMASPRLFLSENERRQAMRLLDAGLDWRLWLVAADGETRDVSWVLERLRRADVRDGLERILEVGLRPTDYELGLDLPGGHR